ncbi:MAG: hypothetical protein ACE5JO_02070 [Candidatus Binatia bacterium]
MDRPRIKDLIDKCGIEILKETVEQGVQEGCQTFDQALFARYKESKVSLVQALINADSATNQRLKIELEGSRDLTPSTGSLTRQ